MADCIPSDKNNYNQFKPNNYKLEIIDYDYDAKSVNFFIQDTSIPGLILQPVLVKHPDNTYWPNNIIEFEQFTAQMILNEDLSNYEYLYNWMLRLRDNDDVKSEMRTIHLFTLGNSKMPLKLIKFHQAWPSGIGNIPLQYSSIDSTPVITSISFAYQYFEIEKIT